MYRQKLDHIHKNVWLGNVTQSQDLELLKENGITHILMCGNELKENFPKEFKYKKLALENYNWNEDLSYLFDEANEFIKQGNCFIHCLAGMHRAPTFTIGYLIKSEQMTVQDAHKLVKQKRSIIAPPQLFLDQLEIYYKNVVQKNQQQLQEKK